MKQEVLAPTNQIKATSVGSVSTGGSWYQPWPQPWPGQPWPQTRIYPTTNVFTTPEREEYANEVEVERGEFDAILRFYRRRGRGRSLVKEITVPIGLLDWFAEQE